MHDAVDQKINPPLRRTSGLHAVSQTTDHITPHRITSTCRGHPKKKHHCFHDSTIRTQRPTRV